MKNNVLYINLRKSNPSDIEFIQKMLYEAVYWRASNNKPSFEEAMSNPDVNKTAVDLGEKDGDIAVIAIIDRIPVGAAWLRYWSDDNNIRGYINEDMPVLVIGVSKAYRHMGIGGKMINRLIDLASENSITQISLCVSKDNYALNLYKQIGFEEYKNIGQSLLMVKKIHY